MLSIPIIETDKFYGLSSASQAFYIHLNLNADDDGVVDKVKLIMGQMRLKRNCFRELVDAGFIIEIEEGLVVITHWHQHNQIRKERYVKGEYFDRLSSLTLQENGRFIKASPQFLGDNCTPQDSIGKDSIVKDSTDEGSIAEYSIVNEREEEKNKTLSLSYLHTEAAPQQSPSGNSNIKMLDEGSYVTSADTRISQALRNAIALYFMRKYQTTDISGFIKECEEHNWTDENGESIINSWRKYADMWWEKIKGTPEGMPL